MTTKIDTSSAPAAVGPYSQAIRSGSLVFCSGQLPIDAATGAIADGIERQTAQCLRNLEAVLHAAGTAPRGVVKTTVFLKDMHDFAAMNAVYGTFFQDICPARSTVEVARLPKDVLIEIEAVAVLDSMG
jgi:2-iminobutanoate/2-iminopropanoate deaminase